eukprot:10415941-Alexandrium_andersonii.AAC.1
MQSGQSDKTNSNQTKGGKDGKKSGGKGKGDGKSRNKGAPAPDAQSSGDEGKNNNKKKSGDTASACPRPMRRLRV